MIDYSQPDFYRFNQDSLQLVKWILTKVRSAENILDLGAGSGIIGIELARVLLPKAVTFVELQGEYLPFLESNITRLLPQSVSPRIHICSFSSYEAREKFELIVCNPPYYLPGRGELSSNPLRALARSFIVDSWAILLQRIAQSLTKEGRCFIILKNDDWLFGQLKSEAQLSGLSIEKEDSVTNMFLLLRLDIDRDHRGF